jgi:thymidylate kinase
MLVALLGPDGVGKTTVAQALVRRLEGRDFPRCHYLRRTFRLLPKRRDLRGKIREAMGLPAEAASERPALDPNAMLPPQPLARVLYHPFYHAIDLFLARAIIRQMRGRGELVLFDRFFFDSYIQRRFMNVPWRLLDYFARLVPVPDLVVCLVGDPAELHRRKPELTEQEIARQQATMRRFVRGRRFSWEFVETGGGIEPTVSRVERAIRRHASF